MTSDRRNKRASREIKLDMESLGERIAPAVYHPGLVSLNLIVENSHTNHHRREFKVDRFEKTKSSRDLVVSSKPVLLPMDKPTIVTTSLPGNSGPAVSTNPVLLPMDKPTIAPDNVAQALMTIYDEYEQDPAAFTGSTSSPGGVLVQGDQVGIEVRDSNPVEFQALLTELTNAGMNITLSSATYGTAVGMLPISELLTVAQFSQTLSINPETAPVMK